MEPSEIGIFLNKSWRPQLRDQTLCFSAWDRFFSAAATAGWAWCNHNAEPAECPAALSNLNLLVGSGDLDFTKNMESLNKHVESCRTNLFTFYEHGQLKGWKRHFSPTVAKAQSWLIAIAWQMANNNTFQYSVQNRRDHNSVTKPMLLYMRQTRNLRQRDGIFCKHKIV